MTIKRIVLAATMLALLPAAQIGTTLAVTGLAIGVSTPAEAKKSKNERIAARLARKLERLERRKQKAMDRAAERLEFSDFSHEATQEPLDGSGPPPFNPESNPQPE